MIERLIRTLQALAAPVDVPSSRHPIVAVDADELALELADALLERVGGAEKAGAWTPGARREAPEWAEVRERARAALLALGHGVDPPHSDHESGDTPP